MVVDTNGDSGRHGVYGHKLSTVVPANITADDTVHELAGIDLAMKLHYLRSVYYFHGRGGVEELSITNLKEPMFRWLDMYYPTAGRIRRSDSGRPFVKCNDGGVRIIETKCSRTLDEWLETKDPTKYRHLIYDDVLGPDLYFSPTVLIQFTRFMCGGMAVGFSWAHVLGDAVAATNCINLWGQLLSGKQPPNPDSICDPKIKSEKSAKESAVAAKPLSIKQVEPVGDCWLPPNSSRMTTISVPISETKLKHLISKISGRFSPFEALSALIWQCLARVRVIREPKSVTICRNDGSTGKVGSLTNKQIISTVTSERSPATLELPELARLIQKQAVDEKKAIEELVDGEGGKTDYVVYGANLTFVDTEGIDLYGLELKGQKPIRVDYSIDGVGEEGAVLVRRSPERTDGDGGRVVTLILPDDQMQQLTEMLRSEWGIE